MIETYVREKEAREREERGGGGRPDLAMERNRWGSRSAPCHHSTVASFHHCTKITTITTTHQKQYFFLLDNTLYFLQLY